MTKQCKVCGKIVDTDISKFIGVQHGKGYDLHLYNCTCGGTLSFKHIKEEHNEERATNSNKAAKRA